LRAVFDAGYYQGAGVTPTSHTPEQSRLSAKPAVRIKVTKPD
jgi:hypothetical protein